MVDTARQTWPRPVSRALSPWALFGQQMPVKAINVMWGKSSLKGNAPKVNSPKLLETLLTVLRHVIKSEEFVRKQNDKENKEDEDQPK